MGVLKRAAARQRAFVALVALAGFVSAGSVSVVDPPAASAAATGGVPVCRAGTPAEAVPKAPACYVASWATPAKTTARVTASVASITRHWVPKGDGPYPH